VRIFFNGATIPISGSFTLSEPLIAFDYPPSEVAAVQGRIAVRHEQVDAECVSIAPLRF